MLTALAWPLFPKLICIVCSIEVIDTVVRFLANSRPLAKAHADGSPVNGV